MTGAELVDRFKGVISSGERSAVAAAIDTLLSAEREACAQIADIYAAKASLRADNYHGNPKARDAALDKFEAATEVAAAIRARGGTP